MRRKEYVLTIVIYASERHHVWRMQAAWTKINTRWVGVKHEEPIPHITCGSIILYTYKNLLLLTFYPLSTKLPPLGYFRKIHQSANDQVRFLKVFLVLFTSFEHLSMSTGGPRYAFTIDSPNRSRQS